MIALLFWFFTLEYKEFEHFEITIPDITQEIDIPEEVEYENEWDRYIDLITMNRGAREWLKRVYRCESGGNAFAQNPTSPASGLMQFMPNTFRGYGGRNIWDGEEQLRVALIMYEIGEQNQWVCK